MSSQTIQADALNRCPIRCAAIIISKWRHEVTGEITFDAYYNGVNIAVGKTLTECIEAANEAARADLCPIFSEVNVDDN